MGVLARFTSASYTSRGAAQPQRIHTPAVLLTARTTLKIDDQRRSMTGSSCTASGNGHARALVMLPRNYAMSRPNRRLSWPSMCRVRIAHGLCRRSTSQRAMDSASSTGTALHVVIQESYTERCTILRRSSDNLCMEREFRVVRPAHDRTADHRTCEMTGSDKNDYSRPLRDASRQNPCEGRGALCRQRDDIVILSPHRPTRNRFSLPIQLPCRLWRARIRRLAM